MILESLEQSMWWVWRLLFSEVWCEMDWNRSTSTAAVLAASIIMANTFNDHGLIVKNLAFVMKWSQREAFKRKSQSVITPLSYVGQRIWHVICACISICCNIRTLSAHQNKMFTCGRNRPAKHYVLGQWKGFST